MEYGRTGQGCVSPKTNETATTKCAKPHLRDGAEAKDLRVADARHVGQHVRNVLERVRHKVIEAREAGGSALVVVLQLAEVGRVVLPAGQIRADGVRMEKE